MSKDPKKVPLTSENAVHRRKVLSNSSGDVEVHYDLTLILRKSAHESAHHDKLKYTGHVKVIFYYSEGEIFLDFVGDIISIILNGTSSEIKFDDHKLQLFNLKPHSVNEVEIVFHSNYSRSCAGLHHFVDPADNNEYTYTQFEPFDCHRVFPSFDQPDVKSTLNLNVVAPSDWVVLGNEYEKFRKELTSESIQDIDLKDFFSRYSQKDVEYFLSNDLISKNYTISVFNKSAKISSYLFALAAGPYHVTNNTVDYPVPMRLFQRKSLKRAGDPQEFFKVTMAGMEWYKEYFGLAYPFNKYDQIFCPEYNMGAMENVGLVTYSEVFLWREEPSYQRKCILSMVILHELAHMWFGNLVTMKWWNDLWLNESFATFISFLCQYEATPYYSPNSWFIFNNSKGNAYVADQQTSTHPVMCDVSSTEVAETHFDHIVYYKGSSFLKQLFKFIGRENFSKGLKNYFETYKWKNTVFSDFITKISEACGEGYKYDLVEISENWLKKSGLNEFNTEIKSEDGKITSFEIIQKPSLDNHNNPQKHLFDILAVRGEETKEYKDVFVGPHEVNKIESLHGTQLADAYIINYNDYGYFKWVIDKNSLNYFKNHKNLQKLDVLSKSLFYQSLFNLTRDSRISSIEYIEIIKDLISHENNDQIITMTLTNLSTVISQYIPLKYISKYSSILIDLFKVLLQKTEITTDTIKILLTNIISYSHTDEQIEYIKSWLADGAYVKLPNGETKKFSNDYLAQDLRFNIVISIHKSNKFTDEEKKSILDSEIQRDKNSDRSAKARFSCAAAPYNKELKKTLWNKYINEPTSESLHNMVASMNHFTSILQIDITEEFINDKFYTDVVSLAKNTENYYLSYFIDYCGPKYFVSEETANKLQKLANENKELAAFHRKINEFAETIRRNLKAHKLCEEFINK